MAYLIRSFDWSSTPVGPVERWPASLKTSTSLILQSPIPMVMLWGEEGVMIYNDGYSVIGGHRHPALLGSNVRDAWPEARDFNDHVMRTGLAGKTLAYRDQEFVLHRKGYPERVWLDLDYSPVLDETGTPAGVIAIVIETTERVIAERRNREEFQRLQNLFSQAPTFMVMLSGPEHRFELVNPEYRKLIGPRDVLGLPVADALPEVAEQGFVELLDHVFQSGEAVNRTSQRVLLRRTEGGVLEERFVDFVYQPIREDGGTVTQIFVQGSDVTDRVRAEIHQKLLINELNHRVKNTLASIQSIVTQTLRGVETKEEAAKAISLRIMALSRAHDVLTRENWEGADLRAVVESSLEAFQVAGRDAIRIGGPDLRVGPHAAISLALALHELATNATKYGALSSPSGNVDVSWSVGPHSEFRMSWTETGGPPVTPSDRRGFGSRLILKVLPLELRGVAHIEYAPSGVVFTLDTSLEAVSDKASGAAS
ncbi:HWE histidine kinase domain-containing protein [Ciceribacter sp. L1K22]|uniref:sensor histidine kinase n=1 Tax=Ciceribacter sp. L1K22 TaxID=2820275 RepID=UPI001ABE4046|nr:HWE histidine kinase domain-containing protein [Ciceribacter sp. L1K22]MBO3761989.1 PAS domain-containing protein [Ciceribacter sp. L1K22]